MQKSYIEDILLEFALLTFKHSIPIQTQDQSALDSFYDLLIQDKELTENQQKYILKILEKYKVFAINYGLDYSEQVSNPQWKKPTRLIDKSKKVWVEENEGFLNVVFKFPFNLKEIFEKEIENKNSTKVYSHWDHERRVRILPLYNTNVIQVNEFVNAYKFEIDESFLSVLAQWEEVWNQQEYIVPHCKIVNNSVELINAAEDAVNYWQENKTNNLSKDLMLAKRMGFLLHNSKNSAVETIAASNNIFWFKNFDDFFKFYLDVEGKVCIVLDRVGNTLEWLKAFISAADHLGVNRSLIKVCFRENKNSDNLGLNSWIKDNNLGGAVEEGQIFIFQHKPAKWLFKDRDSVTILVTNNIYPPTNSLTKDWIEHHPCAIFLGDIKPSEMRNKKIVEL